MASDPIEQLPVGSSGDPIEVFLPDQSNSQVPNATKRGTGYAPNDVIPSVQHNWFFMVLTKFVANMQRLGSFLPWNPDSSGATRNKLNKESISTFNFTEGGVATTKYYVAGGALPSGAASPLAIFETNPDKATQAPGAAGSTYNPNGWFPFVPSKLLQIYDDVPNFFVGKTIQVYGWGEMTWKPDLTITLKTPTGPADDPSRSDVYGDPRIPFLPQTGPSTVKATYDIKFSSNNGSGGYYASSKTGLLCFSMTNPVGGWIALNKGDPRIKVSTTAGGIFDPKYAEIAYRLIMSNRWTVADNEQLNYYVRANKGGFKLFVSKGLNTDNSIRSLRLPDFTYNHDGRPFLRAAGETSTVTYYTNTLDPVTNSKVVSRTSERVNGVLGALSGDTTASPRYARFDTMLKETTGVDYWNSTMSYLGFMAVSTDGGLKRLTTANAHDATFGTVDMAPRFDAAGEANVLLSFGGDVETAPHHLNAYLCMHL